MGAHKLNNIQNVSPTAFIANGTVAVNFRDSVTDAFILITNSETGEVVHHEVFSSRMATTLYIYLEDCHKGVYSIDITSQSCEYSREFMLN